MDSMPASAAENALFRSELLFPSLWSVITIQAKPTIIEDTSTSTNSAVTSAIPCSRCVFTDILLYPLRLVIQVEESQALNAHFRLQVVAEIAHLLAGSVRRLRPGGQQ